MYDDALFGTHEEKNFIETKVNYQVTSVPHDELGDFNAYLSVYL